MLISLVSIHPSFSPQSIPLANAFLKAYARESQVPINLVDFFLGDDVAVCAERLAAAGARAVGFSMYVWNRDITCRIAVELRRRQPSITLFCGGPEVSADPETVARSGLFDCVVVGEGEVPFLSLCQALAAGEGLSGIPGVLWKGADSYTPPSPVAQLDAIPSPYLTGVIDTHANPGTLWQLSRGCSFTCDFCFDSRGIHGVRHFSFARIEAELRHFARTGVSQVFVLDSTFNLDQQRAKRILKLIKKIAPGIHFHFEVRNEFIDREMANLFAQITCSLQIGLQSADREVLKLVGRSFDKSDFTAKVALLNESGAVFGFDLIYGLPGDTLDGFCRSLDYALSLYPNHLDVFPLAVLPGTRLASRGLDMNLKWEPKPPYLLESTDTFSVDDMNIAAGLAAACDIFYSRGKAVAWFNSIVTVIGLRPSELLQKFSVWLTERKGRGVRESDLDDGDIWVLQQQFLQQLFSHRNVKRFLPLVLDLITYHYQYAAALLSPVTELCENCWIPDNVSEARYKLAPSARIMHFTYDIDELLDYGEPQIRAMYSHLQQSGSQAIIFCNGGMVRTESLAAPYLLLLEQMRDQNGRIDVAGAGLTRDEAREFIIFALQEGILAGCIPDKSE